MRMKKIGTAILGIVGALSIIGMAVSSGCTGNASASVQKKIGDTTWTLGGSLGSGGGGTTPPKTTFFTANALLDITGTTYPVGQTGTGTVTVLDGSNTMLGATTFGWTQSAANTLVATDPTSVDNYIAGFPTAANYTVEVSGAPPPDDGTSHTSAVAFKYQGVTLASASATFAATCPPPIVHSPVRCHL